MNPNDLNAPVDSPLPPTVNQSGPSALGAQPITPASWPETPKSNKTPLIIGAASIGVVLALAGGAWAWASSAKSQYVKAVPAYEASAKAANDYFLKLDDRLSHGADIQKKLDQTIAAAPKEPKLLGLSLAPTNKVKRVNDLTNALRKFESTYVEAANVSAYSEKTLSTMADATGAIDSLDSMKIMKVKFEQAKTTLGSVKPPASVKDFNANTITAYQTVIDDIDGALTALDKGDTKAYTTNVWKLADDVQKLSPNKARDELETIFNTAYAKADTAYGELQKLLGLE